MHPLGEFMNYLGNKVFLIICQPLYMFWLSSVAQIAVEIFFVLFLLVIINYVIIVIMIQAMAYSNNLHYETIEQLFDSVRDYNIICAYMWSPFLLSTK